MSKNGVVVQFRLNPEDIMSCIDVINLSNISKEGMSIAMVCRLVLSSYLHGSREKGMIPKRDGYEYTAMIQRFTKANHARKVDLTNTIFQIEASQRASDITSPFIDMADVSKQRVVASINEYSPQQPQMNHADDVYKTPDAHMVRKRARVELVIDELEQRRAIDEQNFTPAQHARLIELHSALIQLNNDVDVDVRALLE